ncbi:MAG: hypothetical protein PHV97_00565 [Candidatus Omnitrophica bacterium]|nr:hypothetical protein [Candidatus Omnitrophota bacterium]
MDEKDRLLLTCLRNGLPLIPRPFDSWSAKIGADIADLLVRIQRLKKEGSLGGVRAILDPRAFHYQSAWVAAKFDPKDLGNGAKVLWRHPGVIYGCEREHDFNLWFFIAVPAGHDLELHVRCLEKLSGAQRILFLPARKVFKGTDLLNFLDAETFPAAHEHFEKRHTVEFPDLKDRLSAEEIGMIRQLQEPFPLTDEPYRKIAADLGITEAQALERIKALLKKGCLKRIGSFSKPAAAIPEMKTLVVWQIPEETLERIGPEIAGFSEVLSADQRPAFAEFPCSFYTMIRAGTPSELEVITRRMQDRIGKWPCRVLVTTREFKKKRMKYFPKELDAWWRENHHVVETAFH